MKRILPALIPLMLVACEIGGAGNGKAPECLDHAECGELQACIENACLDVECLTSSQCELGHFCNTHGDAFVCKEGCESSDDCAAGEECTDNTCEDYGCRSTTLDCPVGTSCDSVTGNCNEVADLCTSTCDVYDSPNCGGGMECAVASYGESCQRDQECGSGYSCDMFLTAEGECMNVQDCPDGTDECYSLMPGVLPGQCVANFCHKDYCLPKCREAEDCPAGFSCEQGVCWGDCEWYVENGYL